MKQKCILIYLNTTKTTRVDWVRWNEKNEIIESVEQGDFEQLAQFHEDDVYVILPNEDILLMHTTLPKLSRAKILQALPYALEDQLIADLDDLHFAIGKHQPDGMLPVAIVSKQKIASWIELFQTIGLTPLAFIPAVFLLPFSYDTWYINVNAENALVRLSEWSGFACDKNQLTTWLTLKKIEDKLPELPPITQTEFSEKQLLENRGQLLLASSFINLLQGQFQPKRQAGLTRTVWRTVAYLTLTYALLALLSNGISFFILKKQALLLEKNISAIYFRQFPQAKSLVAPKERMAEKLRKLTASGGKNVYFILVGELGKSLMAYPGLKIQHLAFNDQRINLDVSANSFDQIGKVISSLIKAGLNVKQQNASTTGNEVKATLILSTDGK